ncbi:uncharacterized protein F5Z01DRAFT_661752 [Emericellopsis atlantica]|uniref:Zn(2)-C6 fungal-type domain-containing protein n=1 Tax=Emericellopsis atlantica TaxID=2614577 RepID=A0A9P8CM32_9HYPO|nr:uncharacterized protein F5Z01DRAFT_661752 [Emericellopsis atlantica]KAG9252043.1 hypothetical protein F5Z01DRAFT_661752 [Emericellopsis atlantica]
MATKHRLRRSCAFCRARKIKCSNETICEACRRQGADCIYDFEPPRPKARGSMDTTRSESIPSLRHDLSPLMGRQRSNTGSSIKGSPIMGGGLVEEPLTSEDGDNVASILDLAFFDNFTANAPARTSHPHPDGMVSQYGDSAKFSSILSLLSHDLVGLSANQMGSLGCSHVEDGNASFFLSGLDKDETPTMFDSTPPPATNPVTEYGQRQQTQLIDVWYSSHPLSFLVSKTLLLRELRDGTHDEVLLAVMLAEANFTIGGEAANTRGRALLQHAQAQLHTRPFQTTQNTGIVTDSGTVVYSGISTRIFSGISTAQALMLLGWHAMTESQFRRAITYIQLAGRMASDLKEQLVATDGMQLSSRINGIDVYDVEKELIDYLYWTTYTLTLWVYVQTGRGYFASQSPTVLTSIFLPATEDASSAIQLDLISENVNTLQKQKLTIKEMWPLAHIGIAVAHACGFHPLQHGVPAANVMQRCRDTNRFLVDTTRDLNKKGNNMSSTAMVLTIYHTLAVQYLFPNLAGQEIARPDIVERMCYSIEEVLQVFGVVSVQPKDALSMTPSLQASLPAVFGMALDTCSRALRALRGKRQSSGIVTDFPSAQVYAPTIQTMASRLYHMSKSDFLHQSSSLRMIRKQLKGSSRNHISSRASVSGSESDGSLTMSPSSDDLSTATTPEMDGQAGFVSPKDMTTMPSPKMMHQPSFDAGPQPHMVPPKQQAWPPVMETTAAPHELMYNAMDTNALGIQSREDLSLSGMVDLQHAWLPQMPPLTEADMNNFQWDWNAQSLKQEPTIAPTAVWSDMDMVL